MFHVLDHADVVYTGDLSQSTQYVIERYGKKLDEAVRSGIDILYSDARHSLMQAREMIRESTDLWHPIEDWKVD
jgi:hypothetical protein